MEKQPKNKILIIGVDGMSTRLLLASVQKDWNVVGFIVEDAIPGSQRARQRAKKIGWFKTLGQVLFIKCVLPFVGGKNRRLELFSQVDFPEEQSKAIKIVSVNDPSWIHLIEELNADYILLSGCRILSKEILQKIEIPVLNIHAGITPKYRGVHGGYWALRNDDAENFGVTLHQVDAGIDTGKVIGQKKLTIKETDNFKTYPFVQLLGGLELLKEAQNSLWEGQIPSKEVEQTDSHLYYHPTARAYIIGRITKGVR